MAKILVPYYNIYGHVETMSGAVAEGVRNVEPPEVVIKRVPELVRQEVVCGNREKALCLTGKPGFP